MEHFYSSQDMARLHTDKCMGCGKCCRGMGDSIHLDPYDLFQLCKNLHTTADELIRRGAIAFHTQEGLTLPHLAMSQETDACTFLGENGLCSIHTFRPGICRLFPLGRNYDADTRSFQYFIVEDGCDIPGKAKVKISKWLGVDKLPAYEKYISEWHYFIKDVQKKFAPDPITGAVSDPEYLKQLSLFILKVFFLAPYDYEGSFYETFEIRLGQARSVL